MALMTARQRWFGTVSAIKAPAWAMVWSMVWAMAWSMVCVAGQAQLPIGSVSTLDATVTGANSVANDRAQLGTNGIVVAKDHVAYVQLLRGGSVKVCATSGVHLTAGTPSVAPTDATPPAASGAVAADVGASSAASPADPSTPPSVSTTGSAAAPTTWAANIPPPLMVALDRGAMELRMGTVPGDIVMTPDLRFSFAGDGQLDVHVRVTRNGDTCIENRVAGLSGHPSLKVGSLFGNETYDVLPGQHVLFEGGNLHEVVDNESSPCGCPEAAVKPPAAQVSDLSPKKAPKTLSTQAAVQHPFPADVSQGLAPPPPVPQAPPGVTHTQVAATLVYNGASPETQANGTSPDAKPAVSAQKPGFFHSVGRFFKRIF